MRRENHENNKKIMKIEREIGERKERMRKNKDNWDLMG